ncbi:MAG TPA: sigma-70 family RNA polymerase sigma factor [Solirubrobacteraceae bacterium]|jgi:RNA polymerase sigma factor (sigma-70 family)
MNTEDSEDDPDRDARLLRRANLARGRADGGLSFDLLLGELLSPWWEPIRRITRWRLHTLHPSETDLSEIAAEVFERLSRAIERNTSFGKPFKYVVADNIEWAAIDYARARKRRASETPHDPAHLPQPPAEAGAKRGEGGSFDALPGGDGDGPAPDGLAEQARGFAALIAGLGARDRRILSERFMRGTPPEEIAQMLGIERGALDTATHRALRRLAANSQIDGVRKRAPRSEGEAA